MLQGYKEDERLDHLFLKVSKYKQVYGFSSNKDILKTKMQGGTVVAHRVIKEDLVGNMLGIVDVKIKKELQQSVKAHVIVFIWKIFWRT